MDSIVVEHHDVGIALMNWLHVSEFVDFREGRDAKLGMPALILPSLQANIRAGDLPDPEANGIRYFKVPIDAL